MPSASNFGQVEKSNTLCDSTCGTVPNYKYGTFVFKNAVSKSRRSRFISQVYSPPCAYKLYSARRGTCTSIGDPLVEIQLVIAPYPARGGVPARSTMRALLGRAMTAMLKFVLPMQVAGAFALHEGDGSTGSLRWHPAVKTVDR